MSERRFGIVITAKMRHGDLWKAVKKLGTQKAFADALGIRPSELGKWINLKSAPGRDHFASESGQHKAETLLLLCGKSPDELWPPELRAAIKGGEIGKQLEHHHDVSLRELAYQCQERLCLPSPENLLADQEADEAKAKLLEDGLRILPPRVRRIVELRYGIGCEPLTLAETGKVFSITKDRVRQIEAGAMRKLEAWGQRTFNKDLAEIAGLEPIGG